MRIGARRQVAAFHVGGAGEQDASRYKTVNICSLSAQTWNKVVTRLNRYISDGRVGEYYEAVFAEMVADGTLSFEATFFDPDRWYEIDTLADLDEAERMFGGLRRPRVAPNVPYLPSAGIGPLASMAGE